MKQICVGRRIYDAFSDGADLIPFTCDDDTGFGDIWRRTGRERRESKYVPCMALDYY